MLKRYFEDMFRHAVRLAHNIDEQLYIEVPVLPLQRDVVGYFHLFGQFVTTLEDTVQGLDNIGDEECRQLLSMAVGHAFAHISHIDPHFNFGRLLEDLTEEYHVSLVNRVRHDANAFVAAFKLHVMDDAGNPIDASGEDEERGT